MMYDAFFEKSLSELKNDGRYRTFTTLERLCKNPPYAIWHPPMGDPKEVIVLCSNDYLGMSHHPAVIQAFHESVDQYGAGSGGTRNIAGTSKTHVDLERTMAQLHTKESALLFSSGYIANKATLSTLGRHLPQCVMLSDEKNHASIIRGIQSSRSIRHVFRHNDMADLEDKLKHYPREQPKVIAVVSVYSMDGDFAPLADVVTLAKKYNALSFVDEVHAVGLYGAGGAGLVSDMGLEHDVDIIQGNFAKGYGVVGGYIAGTRVLVDFVRSLSSGFIFTTSLPPAVARACQTSVLVQKNDDTGRRKLFENVNYFKNLLTKTDLDVVHNSSHIVPIRLHNAHTCKAFCELLLKEYGFYVQPINYPTVPMGEERIRVTLTPFHTHSHIQDFTHAMVDVWNSLKHNASRAKSS